MQYSSRSENYSSSLRESPSKWGSGNKESKGYAYKQASYQYSTSGANNSSYSDKTPDKNIDQLDALLEDLKNERDITRDRDHSLNYRTIERSTNEDPLGGTVTKTTRVIKTSKHTGGLDDVEILPSPDYNTLRSNGTLVRSDYQTLDKSYGSKNLSPGGVPVVSATSATPVDIEEDFKNITINEDILPVPGTKVTTTVRTYTYEIPANVVPAATSNTLSRKNVIYNTVQTNETNNIVQPHPVHTIPQTVVYNTESYSTLNKGSDKPIINNQSYEVREHYESNTLRNNTLPLQPRNPPPTDTTIVYNINNTTTTTTTERPGYPNSPNLSPKPLAYTSGPHSPHSPPHSGPTAHRYYYKESTNTLNTIHGGPSGPGGPGGPVSPVNEPKTTTPVGGYPPNGNVSYPPNANHTHPPGTVTYHYSSTTTNTSNNRRGPDYGNQSPQTMPPAPFPVDGVEYPVGNGNPPQRVEELMQSFGNADVVDRKDLNTPRKREIETAVASPNQQQIVPSINRAGRDVYYPPGHEMMLTKREEMHAGSQAGGRWAKGSGMYEYESGYKSKSKTKTSGAMVPVCLPLCCAMPCSIM
ncbi:hypothetical protein DOY81_000260 [Sarcophaga bullata]|nr:hypothetical protein DOY81_000260 [Sarcophaga bullata]